LNRIPDEEGLAKKKINCFRNSEKPSVSVFPLFILAIILFPNLIGSTHTHTHSHTCTYRLSHMPQKHRCTGNIKRIKTFMI